MSTTTYRETTLSEFAREDQIDSRDLIERLDALEDWAERAVSTGFDDELRAELEALRKLKEETEGYAGDNWRDGVFFIRDSFFRDYAEELADDIGAVDREADWPTNHIDWEAAADDLKQDYTECEIDGVSYWYR